MPVGGYNGSMSHTLDTPRPRAARIEGPLEGRFWPKVERRGEDECWPWLAGLTRDGYGTVTDRGINRQAHRVAWELANGTPWPAGLVADHTCHGRDAGCPGSLGCEHRRCCNPRHIEPVTQLVNLHRSPFTNAGKAHCPAGHPYDEANTYRSNGRRLCRACRKRSK